METLNYWKQFEHTGRVEDYLSYVSGANDLKQISPEDGGVAQKDMQEQAGVNPYAGIHMGNRDDIKTDAYRGI